MNNPKHTLPNGWSLKKLGEIFDITSGTTPSRVVNEYFEKGTHLWVKTTDLNNNFISDTEEKVTDLAMKETSLKKLPVGTVLVAMYGGFNQIGRTGLLQKEASVNQALSAILPKRDIVEPYFLLNWLNCKVEDWKNFAASSRKDPNITKSDVMGFPMILPPLPEQQKIADILGTWDAALQTTTALLTQLEQRKKGLMQRLLSPKEEQRMIEIGEIASELSIRNKKGYDFTVLSCTKYEGLVDSLKYFGRKIYSDDLSTYKIVPQNAFAYATNHIEEGSIGYQRVYQNALISPMYTVFKTSDLVDDSYLFFVLKSDRYIKIYQQNMSGSIDRRGALRWVDFAKLKIPFPPLAEQIRIAEILNAADAEIRETKAYLEQLKAQKRGLMQQLLTGKVRVKTT